MGGGSGTAADPFRICAVSELNNIMDNPDAHYRLYRDLSLPRNFGGIGYSSPGLPSVERFRGTFNGDGYTIRNFKYDGGEEARGFFYVLGVGSHIHDLNFEDVELYGASHMGVLAAVVLGGVIEDVHAQGTLHFNAYQKFGDFSRSLGGLIGTVAPGLDEDVGRNIVKIRRSSFQGTIHPADDIEENRDVGGLIGGIYGHGGDAFVEESFADVTMQLRPDVDKFLHVGGLIGLIEGNWHNDSSIHVRDSYSIGSISIEISGEPDRMAGGLVGTLYVPKPSVTWKIENTYSLVDFPQTACGGLIGSHHNSTGTPTNSYRRSNAVTECDFDNRYGHSLEVKNGQFGSPNEFNGFNFNTTWHYSTELGRPILRWEMQ